MPSFANITVVGHLARDPEVSTTSNGKVMAKFSLPVGKKYKGEEKTTWWKCTAFGASAEFAAKYLKKGSLVLVIGEAAVDTFTKKDGTVGISPQVTVNTLQSLGGKPAAASQDVASAGKAPYGELPYDADNDIPF